MNSEETPSASSPKKETSPRPVPRMAAARLIDKIERNVAESITNEELNQSGGQQKTMLMDETEVPQ